jgi:hypothetical protein
MMRHTVDPVELIRNNNPVSDAHQLPDGPDSASAEALFEEIIGLEHQEPTPTRSRRQPRIGRVAALAAAFLVLSAGAAIAAGVFSPDPEEVATIEDDGAQHADVHMEGWRPGLKAETVWCMYDSSTGAITQVSEFPLGEPLTTEALLAECGTDNDVARNQDGPPTQVTICEATFTDQMYSDRLGVDDRFVIVEGDLADERPGFPVVLAWNADCGSTQLDTSFDVELSPLHSLDDINQAREVEVGLKAAALQSCLSLDEAKTAASNARAELGATWLVLDFEPEGPVKCFTVDLDLEWGTISPLGSDDGTPATPNDTLPPTTED